MIDMPRLVLCIVDTINYGRAILSLRKSLEQITPARTIFFTNRHFWTDKEIEYVEIPLINDKADYSRFIVKELYKYIDTDYILLTQHDGYVINGDMWRNEFLKYSYIGAKWLYPDGRNVGNGGFSLRSKKLMEILGTDPFIEITDPEDEITCRLYRRYLEKKYRIKFAPEDVADKFAYELNPPVQKTFGFHSNFYSEFREHIVLKRTAAMGDLVMLEPVMEYYHNNGYQVVLDTLPQFMELFVNHYYPVIHVSQMNPKINPKRVINFDLAYEITPKKLVLKSYINVTGEDIPLRNARLTNRVGTDSKFFDRYILIHVDETGMPYRNAHGINWAFVVQYFQRLNFSVYQIGKRMKDAVAPYFNTVNLEALMFMVGEADAVIGIDSGVTQISVALGTPTAIFFGAVRSEFRYYNFDRIEVIHTPCITEENEGCYHSVNGSVTGVKCIYNEHTPPCTRYTEFQVIEALNRLLNK